VKKLRNEKALREDGGSLMYTGTEGLEEKLRDGDIFYNHMEAS